MGVIDGQTSEVYIYHDRSDSWYSIGKPSETTLTKADWPK